MRITFTSTNALWLVVLTATAQAAGPPDYTNVPLKELGIELVQPRKDASTGFLIGGKNATNLVVQLPSINGRPIADLEWDMRPGEGGQETGKDRFVRSRKGFLGKEERLLDVLVADNRFVVDERGLTHQELARHLRVAAAVARAARGKAFAGKTAKDEKLGAKKFNYISTTFLYHGQKYKAGIVSFKGYQESPFRDDTRGASDYIVVNLASGKYVEYAELVPAMIERYGFYEGKGTPYRVEPAAIVDVFDFLKTKK
ncbi:MAG: hypothetical protein L0215_10520 [Gemmataceae bacterium]|nr:hypothetical protein [Gemmataceae bacterium]